MKHGTFYSRNKEDQFVFELLVKKPGELGYFLDLGSGDGVTGNNTVALEKIGWTGLIMDQDAGLISSARQTRQSRVELANPELFDWPGLSRKSYDYLSYWGDSALSVLTKVIQNGITFKAATVRYGNYRQQLRDLFQQTGYVLMLGDIGSPPTEDWWVAPSIKSIMFDLSPYLTQSTTILPAVPCTPCGKKK